MSLDKNYKVVIVSVLVSISCNESCITDMMGCTIQLLHNVESDCFLFLKKCLALYVAHQG